MSWNENVTQAELQELYEYKIIIREICIGIEEGYKYTAAIFGCDPFCSKKSPRAAYNKAKRYIAEKHLTPVVTDELSQCPYEAATRCVMDEPCEGCETYAAYCIARAN